MVVRQYPKYNTNPKYQRELNNFKNWVDDRALRPTDESFYIVREYIDAYYVQCVEVERININADSTACIHRALQWYADNFESTPGNNTAPLTVRDENEPNSVVNQSLWRRELSYVQWLRTNGETDAHANLPTNSLSFADHHRTMKFLLSHTQDEECWSPFGISWSVNFSTYIRMDSLRKISLPDLVTEGRGYEDKGPNCDILGIILQKYLHKADKPQNPNSRKRSRQGKKGRNNPAADNNGQAGGPIAIGGKRVCFMWRHRHFEVCGTAMIGISLFMRLFFDTDFSFREPEKPAQPPPAHSAPAPAC
jgi:heme-degrading monooxygenase HmoA